MKCPSSSHVPTLRLIIAGHDTDREVTGIKSAFAALIRNEVLEETKTNTDAL